MVATGGGTKMPAIVRVYLAHERAVLGTLMVILFLIAWEGLERGWWAQLLHPLIGTQPSAGGSSPSSSPPPPSSRRAPFACTS